MASVALIFDLDGTIWDSASWYAAALGRGDAATIEFYRGELLTGGNIVSAMERARITRSRLIAEATRLLGPPPLFAGVRAALETIADRGIPLGVATSLPGTLAEPMLQSAGIAQLFRAVIHAGICRTAKPHPRSLLMAGQVLGVAPGSQATYVGDRASDAEAARRAGMGFAWMAHGYEHPDPASNKALLTPDGLIAI